MSRIEKLSSQDYRDSLVEFYFLEVNSPYARREASCQHSSFDNSEATRQARHFFEENGCVIGKWTKLESELNLLKLMCSVVCNGKYISVRLRCVSADSEEAVESGDYVMISSRVHEPIKNGKDSTMVDLLTFEPVTYFEKCYYTAAKKEKLFREIESAKSEVESLELRIQKLDEQLMRQ